jgi:hypothetical protein
MAFGEKAIGLILAGASCLAAVQFPARHDHLNGSCAGTLTVDERGISFTGERKHEWSWGYGDIQQLRLSALAIRVETYKDNAWELGRDRVYEFRGAVPVEELYPLLRARMDQRLVAEVARAVEKPLYSVAVKQLGRIRGSEGTLEFGPATIVYATDDKGQSRTWRRADIENISSSGRFQLSITTLEKTFNFQLKEALEESRYNELWRMLH